MAQHNLLGHSGEETAARYLMHEGYTLHDINWRCGHLEIDIVAEWYGEIVFVEVKTRTGDILALPSEAVTRAKQERYRKIALFLCAKLQREVSVRYDVASVLDGEIEYFEGAFI